MFEVIKEAIGILACIVLLIPALSAQTPIELLDRMHRVELKSSLDDDTLKPWYLKLTVELYDGKDALKEKGTIEERWSNTKSYRIVYDFPSYAATEVHTEDGAFRTPGKSFAPYFIASALRQVVHPLTVPPDTSNLTPSSSAKTVGALKFDCISFQTAGCASGEDRRGFSQKYYLRAGTDELLVSFPFETAAVLRTQTGVFQGRELSLDQKTNIGTRRAVTAHVETLRSEAAPSSEIAAHDGLERYSYVAHDSVRGGKTDPGGVISKVQPIYPVSAKFNHIAGTVVMAALIDKTGHIAHLDELSSPDQSLTEAAMNAVRLWTYKPYLVNDVPVEVDTLVTVNFSLSRPL